MLCNIREYDVGFFNCKAAPWRKVWWDRADFSLHHSWGDHHSYFPWDYNNTTLDRFSKNIFFSFMNQSFITEIESGKKLKFPREISHHFMIVLSVKTQLIAYLCPFHTYSSEVKFEVENNLLFLMSQPTSDYKLLRNKTFTLGQIFADNYLICRNLWVAVFFCLIGSRLNWKAIEDLDNHVKHIFQISLFLKYLTISDRSVFFLNYFFHFTS